MQLEKHGLKLTTPEVNTISLAGDGRALVLYSDVKKAAAEIAEWSQKDAASYADFGDGSWKDRQGDRRGACAHSSKH